MIRLPPAARAEGLHTPHAEGDRWALTARGGSKACRGMPRMPLAPHSPGSYRLRLIFDAKYRAGRAIFDATTLISYALAPTFSR